MLEMHVDRHRVLLLHPSVAVDLKDAHNMRGSSSSCYVSVWHRHWPIVCKASPLQYAVLWSVPNFTVCCPVKRPQLYSMLSCEASPTLQYAVLWSVPNFTINYAVLWSVPDKHSYDMPSCEASLTLPYADLWSVPNFMIYCLVKRPQLYSILSC